MIGTKNFLVPLEGLEALISNSTLFFCTDHGFCTVFCTAFALVVLKMSTKYKL